MPTKHRPLFLEIGHHDATPCSLLKTLIYASPRTTSERANDAVREAMFTTALQLSAAHQKTEEPTMPKPFDLQAALAGAPVLLRDGSTARVVHYNPNAKRRGAVLLGYTDVEEATSWHANGAWVVVAEHTQDIIGMAPRAETRTGWVNVYANYADALHPTRQEADDAASAARIACVEVTYSYEV